MTTERERKRHREYMRAYYRKNRERINGQCRERRAKNPSHFRAATKRYAKARMDRMTPEQRREFRLRAQYNLSTEAYNEMLVAQGGGCAICHKPPSKPFGLDVDHDHGTKRGNKDCAVRGLLCRRCNIAVGVIENYGPRMVEAIDYVLGHQPSALRWLNKANREIAA